MGHNSLIPVPFHQVQLKNGFWKRRISTVRKVTAQVCVDQCENTHRIDNFRCAAGRIEGEHQGRFFNDSDVYKVIEGIAYILMDNADPRLTEEADGMIDAICAAQQADGYLNTYFTLSDPQHRWTDMSYHEAYCIGHMVEAAVAYHQATGKDQLLSAAMRAVLQMMSVNGPGKNHWVTGHQELELALLRLYRHTKDSRFLEYAEWLINERGHGHLQVPICENKALHSPAYCQDDVPVRALSTVTGHAVRAMYYYSAIADLAALKQDHALHEALAKLWNSIVPANYYITGGIGQSAHNEGFTQSWSLPNLTAYCETCASVGMAIWNHRMGLIDGNGKFADVVETEMYNGIISGISLAGDRFFYENPLASIGTHHREPWFDTSCCPTNLVRFIPSVCGYAYAVEKSAVYVLQYLPSTAQITTANGIVSMDVDTRYPWDGAITIRFDACPANTRIKLRIPGWCKDYTLFVNAEQYPAKCIKGFVEVSVSTGAVIELTLAMPVRRVYADPRVAENKNRVAVARGAGCVLC